LLAREKGHPGGDEGTGCDILVPLDDRGHLDPVEWKAKSVGLPGRQFAPGREDRIGLLRRKPGGKWYFDFADGERDDEMGVRFEAERFALGEYVSVSSAGTMHTYQVAPVEKP
jgi:hypothetical protein